MRRQRLITRLHELVHHRLALVVAPAGYGKSTLLADFAADCVAGNVALTVCRYAAAPWDADGPGLLAGIAAALGAELPGVGDRTRRLLERARAGGSGAELRALLDSAAALLAEELAARPDDYVVLAIDDYHHVDESETGRRLVGLLLDRLPPQAHVLLLSRAVPRLDTARLVAAGEAAGLGPREIAFTQEELALFLRQRYDVEPEPALVAEIQRWTEGWITGLILAMPSLPPGQAEPGPSRRVAQLLSTLSGARRGGVPLHEYLAAELLRQQTPEDRDLLLAAALPEDCDAAQLDEVLARGDASATAATLARLERSGVPMTGEASRVRLHALLREYLRAHLERAAPERHVALRRRWAGVAAAHGEPAAALEHALAAGWWDRAAALLEEHGQEWIDRGRHGLVEDALAALPAHVAERRPRLLVHRARLAYAQGQAALAVERARQAFFLARQKRDSSAEVGALLIEAIAALAARRSDEALQLCLQALEHRAVRRDRALRAAAYRQLGTVEGLRGLFPAAAEHLQRALTLYEGLGMTWETARVLNNLGLAHRQLGNTAQAIRCHERSLALRRDIGDPAAIAMSLSNLAVLRFCAGGLDHAAGMLHEAIDITRRSGQLAQAADRYVTLGDVLRAQRRPLDALRWYQAARALGGQVLAPRWEAFALVGEAGAHLDLEAVPEAEGAARRALEGALESGAQEICGHARALLAAALLRRGRRREAAALLEQARSDVRETGSKELHVRVHLWSGQLAFEEKRWAEATTYVQLAAEAAQALGGPTLIALEGRTIAPLLALAARHGIAPDLLARALETLDRAAAGQVRDASAGYDAASPALAAAPAPADGAPPAPRAQATPTPQRRRVTLRVLGDFSAHLDGREVTAGLPPGGRARELLAYLALHPAGRRRDEITADLWPDAEAGQQVTLFHTTCHRLRQALFPELLLTPVGAGGYRLNPELLADVDVRRFEAALRGAAAPGLPPERRRRQLAGAVEAYGGPFFVECYADWAEDTRRRLEREYAGALAQLVDLEWGAEDHRACLLWCGRLLQLDPHDDAVHARMLECYEALDEPLAGVLHYRRLLEAAADAERSPAPGSPTPLRPARRRLEEVYRRLAARSGA